MGIIELLLIVFTIRNASVYDDMFIASKDETTEQIANAEWVYKMVSKYIERSDRRE